MNAMNIQISGILKTGESSTGNKSIKKVNI
jgi:hypothetical protein